MRWGLISAARGGWGWRMRGLLLFGLLWPAGAGAAPKLEPSRVESRLTGHELSDAGLDLRFDVRDHCMVKLGKEPRELECSEWSPLQAAGEARKLLFKGDLDVGNKSKAMLLRGAHEGGEAFSVRLRLGEGAWVDLEPAEPGSWRLDRGAVGAWALRGEGDWSLDVQVRAGDAAVGISEGAPLALAGSSWGRFAPSWACDAMTWLGEHWAAGGVRPSAVAALPAEVCPEAAAAAARTASCEAIGAVGHVLAQSGDLDELTELVADGRALVEACDSALEELARSGALAREYLETTQNGDGLISLARTWGELLGEEWAAVTRKAGADAALQDARRTGETAALVTFLQAFPESPESGSVAASLIEISAKLELPCGSRRGCPELPAGSTVAVRWTDVPGRPASARLVAWSKADGGVSLQDALTSWAAGAEPAEVEAAVAALAGEASAGAWSVELPVPLKRLGDGLDGYAIELQPEGLEPVLVPVRVEASFGDFPGRSRAIWLRADGASRVDEPGGEAIPLATVPLAVGNHRVHGRHLYVWTRWSPEGGRTGPEPTGLVRVDLDVGGLETVLAGEPVAEARVVGGDLLLRIGAGCSLAAGVAAGRSTPADLATHPGGKRGPAPAECRTARMTDDGLVDDATVPPEELAPTEPPSPEGIALVTDEVAGSPELFVVEEATGRRLQVSRAHALRKDYAVPEGCEPAQGFATRWAPDGRLVVHHGLARCGEELHGPLWLVTPTDGASLPLAPSTAGLPAWVARSWASDRGVLLTVDGSIVRGEELIAGDPAVIAAWWYRPRLVDVMR